MLVEMLFLSSYADKDYPRYCFTSILSLNYQEDSAGNHGRRSDGRARQGGRRGTQGHSRPMTREANRNWVDLGSSPEKFLWPHPLDSLKMLSRIF